jgi:hypothetical protein
MWHVVEAYAGERSFYIKFNWPFLGADVVLPKLHHILLNCHRDCCSLPFISSEPTKTNMGCSCQTNNKHVFGVGKGKWCMLEGGGRIFQVWIKIQLIYNPTNVSLPIDFQTSQTYTFQSFKPLKTYNTPTNPNI